MGPIPTLLSIFLYCASLSQSLFIVRFLSIYRLPRFVEGESGASISPTVRGDTLGVRMVH
jgi:hypothetical protein